MKGVIYARYSPGPNQTEQSIEGQVRECEQFAKENDITIIATYADRRQTGRNDNRAEFQKMLRDSKRRMFDCVIVWKIDRFGRNREEIAKNKALLRLNGARVLFAKEHIPDGPEGIILESVLEGLAEYYSANLSQNIIRGMRESAMKCQSNGSGLALGYRVDSGHKFHIDEDGAAVVKLIFEKFDSGEKVADIQRYLNSHGLKTLKGKEFTHFGVTRILRNRQYIGEYKWRDVVVPDGMPRIINDDLFERVQRRMEKNKKAPSAGRGEVKFLLTGKLFCGKCKSTMLGDSGTSKNGNKFYYYTCRKKKHKSECTKKSVKKDWLEREVVRITRDRILVDDTISFIADRVIEIQNKEFADTSMLDYYNGKLKDVQKSISNLMKAIEAGIITETTKERLLDLEDQKEELICEIEKEKYSRPATTKEQIVYFMEQFKDGDLDDKAYQERVIDTFVNKVILYDDKITITYNHSGENNEVDIELIEEAADDAGVRLSARQVHHVKNLFCLPDKRGFLQLYPFLPERVIYLRYDIALRAMIYAFGI